MTQDAKGLARGPEVKKLLAEWYGDWHACRVTEGDWLTDLADRIQALLDEKVRDEREACAMLADQYLLRNPKWNSYHQDAQLEIAAAIRERKP